VAFAKNSAEGGPAGGRLTIRLSTTATSANCGERKHKQKQGILASERARKRQRQRSTSDRDRGAHQTDTEDRAMAVLSSSHLSKLLNLQPFLSTVTVISPSAFILTQGEEEEEKEEQTRLNKLPTTIAQGF
jgi:hypothetical protein